MVSAEGSEVELVSVGATVIVFTSCTVYPLSSGWAKLPVQPP